MSTHVNDPEPQYTEFAPIWQTCRDVMGGKRAIMGGGEKYLRKLKEMKPDEYQNYQQGSAWFGAADRTKKALHGMIMEIEPTIELPPAMDDYIEDATMAGESIEDVSSKIVDEVLEVGRVGVLSDHTERKTDAVLTVAQMEAANQRPFLTVYEAEKVIAVKRDYLNNKYQIVQVRLREAEQVAGDDEFDVGTKNKVRVLDLAPPQDWIDNATEDEVYEGELYYRVRIYVEQNVESDMGQSSTDFILESTLYPSQNGQMLTEIPFIIISDTDIMSSYKKPPMLDLVDLNVSYYRQDAQFARSLFLCCAPTLFLKGLDEDAGPIYLGGDKAISVGNTEADGKYLEVSGQSLPVVAQRLVFLIDRMAAMGARMLATEKKQIEAASTHQIKRAGEHSLLAKIANNVSSGLNKLNQWIGGWYGVEVDDNNIALNTDFSTAELDAKELVELWKLVQGGAPMNERDWLYAAKNAQVLNPNLTDDERIAESQTTEPIEMRTNGE